MRGIMILVLIAAIGSGSSIDARGDDDGRDNRWSTIVDAHSPLLIRLRPQPVSSSTRELVAKLAIDSIVKIHADEGGGRSGQGTGGIIYSDNETSIAVTNAHVVGTGEGTRQGIRVVTRYGTVAGAVIWENTNYHHDGVDLSLVSFPSPGQPFPSIPIASTLSTGEPVYSAGFPGGAIELVPRRGNVTPKSARLSPPTVETTGAVWPGESGSPLVNDRGELVAIIYANDDVHGTGHPTRAYAVPASNVAIILETRFLRGSGPLRNIARLILSRVGCGPQGCQPIQPRGGYGQPQPSPGYGQPQPRGGPLFKLPRGGGASPNPGSPILGDSIGPIPPPPAPDEPAKPKPDYVTRGELDKYVKRGELKDYATKKDIGKLDEAMTRLVPVGQLDNYATNQQLDGQVSGLRSHIESVREKVEAAKAIAESVGAAKAGELSWLETLTQIATALGLPIAIPGGIFGFVGFKVLGLWWRHRQRKQEIDAQVEMSKPAGGPVGPFDRAPEAAAVKKNTASGVAGPPYQQPETITRTRHEFTRVPTVNREAEALHEAMSREVKTFPVHMPIVERLRSVAHQILHGEGVREAGRGDADEQKYGVGWND